MSERERERDRPSYHLSVIIGISRVPDAMAVTSSPAIAILPLEPTHKETARLRRLPETCFAGLQACILKTGLLSANFSPLSKTHSSAFIWNALVRSLADNHRPDLAVLLFSEMLRLAFFPNSHSFPFLLKSCSAFPDGGMEEIKQIHGFALKTGFTSDIFTSNSLLHGYGRSSGGMAAARKLFEGMPERDSVSWNTMLKGFVMAGEAGDAKKLFDEMPEQAKNLLTWTTVINGCVNGGFPEEALDFFRDMQLAGISPDAAVLSAALSACSQLGALEQGCWIATFVERRSVVVDPPLACALVGMFCKCGESEAAMTVFKAAEACGAANVYVWTAVIGGLAVNGRGDEALALFEAMAAAGLAANELTITAALTACSYSGNLEKGKNIFRRVDEDGEFCFRPTIEHLGCMVHLLGRAGLLQEARAMAERAAKEHGDGAAAVWGALLSSCRLHGDWKMGNEVGEILLNVDSGHGGRYVNLAAILAEEGKWEEAAEMRSLMKNLKVKKLPGCSSIAIAGKVHEFVAGDCSHPEASEIYAELGRMMARLRENGYEPAADRSFAPGMSAEEKDLALRAHSEKLALAYGLISTETGADLRIIKNLRVCEDCHAACKLVSKIYRRKIVMRDRSRFHLFVDGVCSCGDCW